MPPLPPYSNVYSHLPGPFVLPLSPTDALSLCPSRYPMACPVPVSPGPCPPQVTPALWLFLLLLIPMSHLPPPKTRLQADPGLGQLKNQQKSQKSSRGPPPWTKPTFPTATWCLVPSLPPPSWFRPKSSSGILRGMGPPTRDPSTLHL